MTSFCGKKLESFKIILNYGLRSITISKRQKAIIVLKKIKFSETIFQRNRMFFPSGKGLNVYFFLLLCISAYVVKPVATDRLNVSLHLIQ